MTEYKQSKFYREVFGLVVRKSALCYVASHIACTSVYVCRNQLLLNWVLRTVIEEVVQNGLLWRRQSHFSMSP